MVVDKSMVRVLVAEGHGGERRSRWKQNQGEIDFFFINFGPDFLLPQTMKSTPIYKGWKMDILS
jgi:hypothetical protein